MQINKINLSAGTKQNISYSGIKQKQIKEKQIKQKPEYILDLLCRQLPDIDFQTAKLSDQKAKLKIINGMQYELTDLNSNKLAEMLAGIDYVEQIWCEDEFYKDAKRGSIIIDYLGGKSNEGKEFLIKEAVKKSKRAGFEGRVITYARNTDSKSNLSVPFLYEKGFKAFKAEKQAEIKASMDDFHQTGIYTGPNATYMYLPKEKIDEYLSKR